MVAMVTGGAREDGDAARRGGEELSGAAHEQWTRHTPLHHGLRGCVGEGRGGREEGWVGLGEEIGTRRKERVNMSHTKCVVMSTCRMVGSGTEWRVGMQ